MKFFAGALIIFTLSSAAQASDIQTSICAKDSNALLVEISGKTALDIYSFIAVEAGVPVNELGGTTFNDMACNPEFASGKVIGANCSFLMKNGSNFAYPALDGGFSGEAPLVCN